MFTDLYSIENFVSSNSSLLRSKCILSFLVFKLTWFMWQFLSLLTTWFTLFYNSIHISTISVSLRVQPLDAWEICGKIIALNFTVNLASTFLTLSSVVTSFMDHQKWENILHLMAKLINWNLLKLKPFPVLCWVLLSAYHLIDFVLHFTEFKHNMPLSVLSFGEWTDVCKHKYSNSFWFSNAKFLVSFQHLGLHLRHLLL